MAIDISLTADGQPPHNYFQNIYSTNGLQNLEAPLPKAHELFGSSSIKATQT